MLAAAGVAVLWAVPGVLWPALEAMGVATGLREAAHGTGSLAEPMDAALTCAVRAVDVGLRAGATALVVADDLAGSEGPLLDPVFLRAAVFPRLADLAALARDAGVPAILHSDGDIRALMPAIAMAGFVAVHGDTGGGRHLDASLAAARMTGLTMIGGIPTAALADEGIARAAGTHAGALAAVGGLMPADDGGVTTTHEARALLGALAAASQG
jgi:uroporphyrinogen decarboxylase